MDTTPLTFVAIRPWLRILAFEIGFAAVGAGIGAAIAYRGPMDGPGTVTVWCVGGFTLAGALVGIWLGVRRNRRVGESVAWPRRLR